MKSKTKSKTKKNTAYVCKSCFMVYDDNEKMKTCLICGNPVKHYTEGTIL